MASSHAYQAVVTLIRTRLDSTASIKSMRSAGVSAPLATRYLDLAIVVAAREILGQMGDSVVLPTEYNAIVKIPGLSAQFDRCHISAGLVEVYRAEPTAATLLAPVSSDYIAIQQAMKKAPDDMLGLPAPSVGDGSQIGFARKAFGVEGVLKLAKNWPDLA
jgi:hypothetical protein